MAHQYPEPAQTPEEEKEQHISSLLFHARLADAADNELLGFVISFMARILSDLTVYRRLYATPNKELWERGRKHQIDLVEALAKWRRGPRPCDHDLPYGGGGADDEPAGNADHA